MFGITQKLIFLGLFCISIFSCSTAPEFERDNIYDKGATLAKAKIFFPSNNSNRAVYEKDAFKIFINTVVKEKTSKLSLISDKDGVLFELFREDIELLGDTLAIEDKELSYGTHEISLFLDNTLSDKIYINTILPRKVELLESLDSKGMIKLVWSKYEGENFQKYVLLRNKEPIYTSFELLDTTFNDINFPFRDEINYQVQIFDNDFERTNNSKRKTVSPTYITIDQRKVVFLDNSQEFFYTNTYWNYSTISSYNFITNQIKSIRLDGSGTDPLRIFVNHFLTPNELIVPLFNDEVLKIDLKEFKIILRKNVGYIVDLEYDPINKIYFAALTGYGEPYSFDLNFNFISNYSPEYDFDFFGLELDYEKKMLFIENYGRYNSRAIVNYNSSLQITDINTFGPPKKNVTSNTTKLSNSKKYIRIHNHIYSTENLETKLFTISKPASAGYFTSFRFYGEESESVIAGTINGYVLEYSIPSGELLRKEKQFDSGIFGFFSYESDIYALINNDDLYRIAVVK